MDIKRLFTTVSVKGQKNYLNVQKRYEVFRTVLYFGISVSLFAAGYLTTGEKTNLLTIVAVLGCLPASKSAVSAVMFLKYKSCSPETAEAVREYSQDLHCLYDMVFTSYKKNFSVAHLAVRGNTVCGFSENGSFEEEAFRSHVDNILKMDGHKDVTVKIFTNLSKYTERLEQMKALEKSEEKTNGIISTLKSVAL